ncbi:hypothetical protein BDV93DRAFT_504858 [Ceratobasidium sp. AG-I]|nr:hypothetical protein BDV93DRAFT_504858 [Ceratobasidium sp. AG-I]
MSLAPSRFIINRGLAWSSGGEESGHIAIEFPFAWDTRLGAVFDWYEKQPCKHFRSIQHRQNRDAPFFHQFLLIKLTNGSLCRVERLGDGMQLDAVRRSGCLAHDLVQTFTPDAYDIFIADKPSDLLAEVHLPREIDLLDVLAICYSIQRNNHTCWYTLQRFNCYFLCWTVLAVLTRRLIRWEEGFSAAIWEETSHNAASLFSNLAKVPLTYEAKLQLALRLCSLLDQPSIQPANLVASLLHQNLGNSSDILNDLRTILRQTLWKSSWGGCVDYVLEARVKSITQREDVDALWSLGRGLGNSSSSLDSQNLVVQKYFEQIYTGLGLKWCCGVILGAIWGFWMAITDRGLGYDLNSMKLRIKAVKYGAQTGRWLPENQHHSGRLGSNTQLRPMMVEEALATTLDALDDTGISSPFNTITAVHQAAIVCNETKSGIFGTWLWKSLKPLFECSISEAILKMEQPMLFIHRPNQTQTTVTETSLLEFQEQILAQIRSHANKVAAYQLGSAVLVEDDIVAALSSVWKDMPERMR